MIKLRQSTALDAEQIIQIWKNAVDATHDFLTEQDRIAIEQEVITFLPQLPLWLAVDTNDTPLGFMLLDGSHIEALFIDAKVRGLGIGKKLVQHAFSLCENVTVDVNEQNNQAVGFYQHLEFDVIGRSATDSQGRAYPLLHLKCMK